MNCKTCKDCFEPQRIAVLMCSLMDNKGIVGNEYLFVTNVPAPKWCPKRKDAVKAMPATCEYKSNLIRATIGEVTDIAVCLSGKYEGIKNCTHSEENPCNDYVDMVIPLDRGNRGGNVND